MKNYRNAFKITYVREPYYHIDAARKSVKCYLTCDLKTPDALYGSKPLENVRFFTTGYAKCDDKDAFNVETGKKIALARAESKVYLKAKHMVKDAVKDCLTFLDAAEKFENKCYRICAHNEDYVDQYSLASHPNYKGAEVKKEVKTNTQPRDEHGRFKSFEKKEEPKATVIKIRINRI